MAHRRPTLGERIARKQEKLDLSDTQVAQLTGMKVARYRSIKDGTTMPHQDTIRSIANALGIPFGRLRNDPVHAPILSRKHLIYIPILRTAPIAHNLRLPNPDYINETLLAQRAARGLKQKWENPPWMMPSCSIDYLRQRCANLIGSWGKGKDAITKTFHFDTSRMRPAESQKKNAVDPLPCAVITPWKSSSSSEPKPKWVSSFMEDMLYQSLSCGYSVIVRVNERSEMRSDIYAHRILRGRGKSFHHYPDISSHLGFSETSLLTEPMTMLAFASLYHFRTEGKTRYEDIARPEIAAWGPQAVKLYMDGLTRLSAITFKINKHHIKPLFQVEFRTATSFEYRYERLHHYYPDCPKEALAAARWLELRGLLGHGIDLAQFEESLLDRRKKTSIFDCSPGEEVEPGTTMAPSC